MYDTIRDFLENYGIWTLLILFFGKWATGILVAVLKGEFKWYYLHEALKTDGVALAGYAIVLGIAEYSGLPEFNSEVVQGGTGVLLATGFTAGIVKNLAHILPGFSESVPTTLREPARLRLGNARNNQ